MKTLTTALLISASLAAGVAQAADEAPKTRAQVLAELQDARAAGLISHGELDYPPAAQTTETKSRAEVQAELAAARSADQISLGELDYPPVSAAENPKSRAQVKAELRDYVASHGVERVEA